MTSADTPAMPDPRAVPDASAASDASAAHSVLDWAASGAMALTGRREGPPLLPPGRAASQVREQLAALGQVIPGLLGERAAYAGLRRDGPRSCGGAFRIVATADGWLGLSLAREADVELLPALVEAPVTDPWTAVRHWAATTTSARAQARVRLLGLPGGTVATSPPADRPAVRIRSLGTRTPRERPIVVDLTSLWAGPLCAHLLGLRGARIIKVESSRRPDGARRGPAAFFDLLHRGHEQVTFDLAAEPGRLADLVARADLVLEASRPRALRQFGLVAEDVVAAGTSWLSITAHGRDSDAVGFGDDVAASAGLVVRASSRPNGDRPNGGQPNGGQPNCGQPMPAGDALADPLTGVTAAVAAARALAADDARLIDVSMLHVTAATLTRPAPRHEIHRRGDRWWVECDAGSAPVEEPRPRPATRAESGR